MVASNDALRSMHVHAVSVSACGDPLQFGGHHSAGHPLHGAGRWIRGGGVPGSAGSKTSPSGSPALASGGPTVAGGTLAGSLGFGSSGSGGGRIERVSQRGAIERGRHRARSYAIARPCSTDLAELAAC